MMIEKKDVFGNALWDYHQSPGDQELITWTSLTEKDPVPISYYFRTFDQMPLLEKKALEISYGKVLDVGCGAGSHSLFLQNKRNLSVTGLDNSPLAIKITAERGLLHTVQQSIFDFHQDNFDTILLMMMDQEFAAIWKDYNYCLKNSNHFSILKVKFYWILQI